MTDFSEMKKSVEENGFPASSTQSVEEFYTARPWVPHYDPGVSADVEIPPHPLTWLLDQAVSRFPGNTAIIYYGTRLTYANISTLASRFAAELLRMGLKKGDRVAVVLPNIPQYLIAYYGILRVGGVVVPTNPIYTEREMEHQLRDSGARFVVCMDGCYPLIRDIRKRVPLERIIVADVADYLPPVLRTLYLLTQRKDAKQGVLLSKKELREDSTLHQMSDLLRKRSQGGVELFHFPETVGFDDLAVLQYTGGTTGLSKGAMLTHHNLLANALQTRNWTAKVRDGVEVMLCAAPLFHSYGATSCMNFSVSTGATMVLLPRFKPADVIKTIEKYRPTLFPGIPTMYLSILRNLGGQTRKLQSIRYCISGAAPLPLKVKHDFEAASGGKLVEGYGLSEASPVTHCNPLDGEHHEGSIGLPFPNVIAAIMNSQTGQLVGPGEDGEIVVKGPNVMQGYWQRKEETEAMFVNGWMRTGDIGRMSPDGYFYVLDRAKDMIIASGFNIYPREVEEVLYQHEAVQEAAVAGVPHEYRGETVAAFVVLKPGYQPNEEMRQNILAYCKRELTAYKVPKVLEFRESLPKSLIGKVLKRELRASLS